MLKHHSGAINGACFCGAVKFQVTGPLRDVVNCHCGQCRQLYGNFGSHTKVHNDHIVVTKEDGLLWYRISEKTQRGFCGICGSGLFWKIDNQEATCIVAGCLECPSGLKTIGHVFVEEKSDFYEIADDHEQFPRSSHGMLG